METEIYTEEWDEIEWNRYIRIKINGIDTLIISVLMFFLENSSFFKKYFLENYFIF